MSTQAPAAWQPPIDFEEYHLLEPLGRGAMGEVFLARDLRLDRLVAVKFIAGMAPQEGQRERFWNEARAIARVQHPNVVGIYRVGEVLRRPYLISEFVRGESLDRLPLPQHWMQALTLGIGLARGLAAAHRRDVVHRDLKPANVMKTVEGDVKLLDFGVAKLIDAAGGPSEPARTQLSLARLDVAPSSEQELSRTLTVSPPASPPPSTPSPIPAFVTGLVGTPGYMAPEIWRGQPATLHSDVYSFGVMLYELCTGTRPYRGDSAPELREAVLRGERPVLTRVLPQVDPAFAAIIDRCLSLEPAARFASADVLREALEALREGTGEPAPSNERPYPGLHAFGAEDRATFSGRGSEIRALVDRLRSQPFVLVAGDSGVGKSSLCRAGVLPRVAQGALGPGAWTTCELVPGRHPLGALAATLAPLLGESEASLLGELHAAPEALGRRMRTGAGTRAVLLHIDQLEELLTLAPPEDAQRFALALESLVEGGPRLRVLATARGDFLARLASLPGLREALDTGGLYLLQRPTEAGLTEAVVAPARAHGFTFESPALVETLVSAGAGEGGLPLLQFALAQLWEHRDRERRVIPAMALEALGGVGGALARHADGVLATLAPVERGAARHLLSRLVTAEGTRAQRTREELVGAPGSEVGPARAALEALVRGRLVVAREAVSEDAETGTYELAHEALLVGWDTLRGWLAGDEGLRVLRQRLERACTEWRRLGRTVELLWSGRQLMEAASLPLDALSEDERAFLHASRRVATRKRLGRIAAVLSLPLFTVAVYGGLQLQTSRARERDTAQAVSQARTSLEQAREENTRLEAQRRAAFAAFDTAQKVEGEATWARALATAERVDTAYREAGNALDAALQKNPRHAGGRQLLAEVLFERILLAERLRRPALHRELLQRLALVDDTRDFQRRLDAPARLDLETEPPGARVRVERALEDAGRLSWSAPVTLGTTPLRDASLPPGSYRLSFVRADRPAVLYPVLLERGEAHATRLVLPASVPKGFVYVPPGRFLYGSPDDEVIRRNAMRAQPLHALTTGGYLVGRTEVTHGEYLDFLRTLPPRERAERRPHGGNYFGDISLVEVEPGQWEFQLARKGHIYRAREGEPLRYLDREHRANQDWLRLPVSGISWEDAVAYVTWLNDTGRVPGARLCDEREWERAARGADGRSYPHGERLEPDDANFDATYGRKSLAFGPDEVGSHPASDSPFGLADFTGNVWEWMRSVSSPDQPTYGGGCFYQDMFTARSLNHGDGEPRFRIPFIGLRVCASPPAVH
ncbi:SUMF1/EgtB/PvdOfamily nonheme iron enzyme [Myxococcus llanfairpwllgwyngyllgogerychwyrndrobwllllantysiliogogogochensis]|uniref:SUMF1/EgtB/PvdOfamily nonheme iron enzyme n=1 Tax=Myxococcus llanfairpwllgwyngyllgogerychwyrndrobwllllantysiliogogogochensis TaxID=2590453 RepID=A0A540X2A2_9BACT|nr:SUMF1/EgtB/PvdO family nonheme iron enzyme [Myxococcus llanfairpwllgwyngyllgogerychwyrndrobwllllantysiliogogogochensis]TQF15333.1 SUMF1/EgtB/PvdOfamily nonheme iron enzyme [Myxococcus llanfairpwllgwyngyllgogerychwyrndrobwllllantysiliogogogochensis]